MPIQINNLTQEEIDGLNLTIVNGIVTEASISTLLPEEPTPEPPTPTPTPTEINMVCFGDSNTYGLNLQESEKFCTLLGNNPDITSYNEGISGNTSANLLSRIQTSVFNRKDATKRNILVLLIGTNDPGYGLSLQQSKDNIDSIITQSIAQGWEVIALTYPPSDAIAYNDNLRAINTHITNNASVLGYDVIDINGLFITPANWDINRQELINTQLHFGVRGHKVIADVILSFLGYNTYTVSPEDEIEASNNLTTWGGYTGVSYIDLGANKFILVGKINTMFKLGIIDYAVATGGSPFGGNTSLSGKILHAWEFEGDATDSVGTNDGTVSGATNGSTYGFFNNGYNFDGVNDKITITALTSTSKSFSCWAKKTSTGAWGRVFGNAAGTKYLFQLYNNGFNYCNLSTGTVSWAQTDDTNWHNYVVTANGTTVKIYVDKVLKYSGTNSGVLTGFDQIGQYSSTANSVNNWRGNIDEVYIFDDILSDGGVSVGNSASAGSDVSELYNAGAGLFYSS